MDAITYLSVHLGQDHTRRIVSASRCVIVSYPRVGRKLPMSAIGSEAAVEPDPVRNGGSWWMAGCPLRVANGRTQPCEERGQDMRRALMIVFAAALGAVCGKFLPTLIAGSLAQGQDVRCIHVAGRAICKGQSVSELPPNWDREFEHRGCFM